MKWLLKKVTNFFRGLKKESPTNTSSPQEKPARRPVQNSEIIIALVRGHNSKGQGAVNYLDESEWVFSGRILKKVQTKLWLENYQSLVIDRPPVKSYYSQTKYVARTAADSGCTHAILSHFNAAGRKARGCETLATRMCSKSMLEFADIFTDKLENIGINQRGQDGVKIISKDHSGYGMLNQLELRNIDSVLIEPCFATYKNSQSEAIFENEDRYVDIIVNSIKESILKKPE